MPLATIYHDDREGETLTIHRSISMCPCCFACRSRVHKVLERADIAGDTTTMELLLSGRRSSADDVVDADQIAFLQFYVLNALIRFKQFCNASGCNRIASKHCGKCRVAKYCSRECQVGDWRATHKKSCAALFAHP